MAWTQKSQKRNPSYETVIINIITGPHIHIIDMRYPHSMGFFHVCRVSVPFSLRVKIKILNFFLFQMPVDDLNSMMQLKQQLSHQINQLNSMLGQNPNLPSMMNQTNMNNNMAESGPMVRPNIMIPNYNNMPHNNWNAQVHILASNSVCLFSKMNPVANKIDRMMSHKP